MSDKVQQSTVAGLGPYYKVAEVAEILRTSSRTVERYIRSGELRAAYWGGGWKVDLNDLREFVQQRTGVRT